MLKSKNSNLELNVKLVQFLEERRCDKDLMQEEDMDIKCAEIQREIW